MGHASRHRPVYLARKLRQIRRNLHLSQSELIAKLKVKEVAENIAKGKFEPKAGFHCDWCAYRNLCPATEKRLHSPVPKKSN